MAAGNDSAPTEFQTHHQLLQRALAADLSPERAASRRLGYAVRRLIDRVVGRDASIEAMDAAAGQANAAAEALEPFRRWGLHEGWAEGANSGDPHAFFDRSPLIGHANPLAAPIAIEIVDGTVFGRARFGAAYEGPPGCVHGGFIAASFATGGPPPCIPTWSSRLASTGSRAARSSPAACSKGRTAR